MKVQVLDQSGKPVEEMSLPEGVFSYPVKDHLIYETVVNYLANQRQGTASTKTRAEVSGGGRKPWRQKGTGRARAGSNRSPIWRHGGTIFGPKPRDYSYELPKKARRNALKSALAAKLDNKFLLIINEINIAQPKTKEAAAWLKNMNLDSALIVDSRENNNLFLAVRNIPKVKAVDDEKLNTYDVLRYKWLVFSQKAFNSLVERLK
ncbi:MAG TPA: 50S ribosomal protein L4 [Candidatus Saccharicenans sp.]|jgi:large subunit ribosomal protein L4|nr:50S ribosomal protein L4 [Candidatus Saccharicenans sp.]HRD02248.1 50S ribosomal protein L4 [Candidatus Saccharicenans sp.]